MNPDTESALNDSICSSRSGNANGSFIMDKNVRYTTSNEKHAYIKLENMESAEQAEKAIKFLSRHVE